MKPCKRGFKDLMYLTLVSIPLVDMMREDRDRDWSMAHWRIDSIRCEGDFNVKLKRLVI